MDPSREYDVIQAARYKEEQDRVALEELGYGMASMAMALGRAR